jgi:hypothetical protein
MKYKISICLLLAGLLPIMASGQAKVGTAGAKFLTISPSVRANGMGEAGVALVDNYSVYFNPASLGLLHQDSRVQISFYPVRAELLNDQMKLQHYSISGRLKSAEFEDESPLLINAAYYITRFKVDIPLTTYGPPVFLSATDIAHNFSLGFGILRLVEAGGGINFKIIKESVDTLSLKGTALDFGFMLRLPSERTVFRSRQNDDTRPYFSPSIGFSWNNIGPDMDFNGHDVPIDDFRRFGVALPFGLEKKFRDDYLMLFKIAPVFETVSSSGRRLKTKYGGELGFIETLNVRSGYVSLDEDYGYTTLGFGLQSQGIVRVFIDILFPNTKVTKESFKHFIREDLQIVFDYARIAHINQNPFDAGVDYYGISIGL